MQAFLNSERSQTPKKYLHLESNNDRNTTTHNQHNQ